MKESPDAIKEGSFPLESTGKKLFRLFLDGDNFRQYEGATYHLMLDWMKSLSPLHRWQVKMAVATTHATTCVKRINEIMDKSTLAEVDVRIVRKGEKNAADRKLLAMKKEATLLDGLKGAEQPVHYVLASHDDDLIRKFSREVKAEGHSGDILDTMQWTPPGMKHTTLETLWKLDIAHVHRRREGDAWELVPIPEWRWERFIQDVSRELVMRWFNHHPRAGKLPIEAMNSICQRIITQFHLEKEAGIHVREFIRQSCGNAELSKDGISRRTWEKIQEQHQSGSGTSTAQCRQLPVPADFAHEQGLKLIRKQNIER